MKSIKAAALALLALAAGTSIAAAQSWPDRPVTFVVPFGAGGGTETLARTVAEELGKALGKSVIVDPRPGANGMIGSTIVARAAPDGYTFLFTAQSTYSLNPNLVKEPTYDQLKDLVPVVSIGRSPWLLTVPADSPFKTAQDVIDYGKANPGKLAFPFWQSSVLVTGEMFNNLSGVQMRKVPYKGQVEATTDFLGGRLPIYFNDIFGARPQVEAGKMRVLAATTPKRSASFPDAPTMRELGLDIVTDSMMMVFAPTGTPPAIIEKLNAELAKVVANSAPVHERMKQVGLDPNTMSVAEADAFVRSELTRWADMIAKAGLQKQ